MKNQKNQQIGVTLTELMIVLAIIGIVAAMAMTSGAETKHRLAVKTLSDEIQEKLVQARMVAATHGVRVTFCPVADVRNITTATECAADWNNFDAVNEANGTRGWIVFKDSNADGKMDDVNNLVDKLQFAHSNGPAVVDKDALVFPAGMGNLVRFSRKGNLTNIGNVTIPVRSLDYPFRYEVMINATGSISNVNKTP